MCNFLEYKGGQFPSSRLGAMTDDYLQILRLSIVAMPPSSLSLDVIRPITSLSP